MNFFFIFVIGSTTIITSSENQPRPEHRVHDPVQGKTQSFLIIIANVFCNYYCVKCEKIKVNLTWLMQHTADVTPPRKKKKVCFFVFYFKLLNLSKFKLYFLKKTNNLNNSRRQRCHCQDKNQKKKVIKNQK